MNYFNAYGIAIQFVSLQHCHISPSLSFLLLTSLWLVSGAQVPHCCRWAANQNRETTVSVREAWIYYLMGTHSNNALIWYAVQQKNLYMVLERKNCWVQSERLKNLEPNCQNIRVFFTILELSQWLCKICQLRQAVGKQLVHWTLALLCQGSKLSIA